MEPKETTQTIETQRSEETEWTEREIELAEKFDVEPKTVRLLTRINEEKLTDLKDAITKEIVGEPSETVEQRSEEEQNERGELLDTIANMTTKEVFKLTKQVRESDSTTAENTTGIPGLDRMIAKAPFGTATAIYAGIELGRSSPELGARIQAFVRGSLPEFFEQLNPEKSKDGDLWDNECDVLPAVQWLRFLDGFKAAMPSETDNAVYAKEGQKAEGDAAEAGQESIGDPNLRTIKRWMARLTYQQRLAAILLLELMQKESEFDEPDNNIGNDFIGQWRREIIDASGDQEYLKNADPDEVAVTAATATMIPWKV